MVLIFTALKSIDCLLECIVRPTCFSEKKATKNAKYLGYTVKFEKPCTKCILAMDLINMEISNLLITPLNEIDDMSISEMSEDGSCLLNAIEADLADGVKFGPEAYAMYISITQRNSDKCEDEFAYAYYRLGSIFYHYFKEFDHAINLYSRAIDLDQEEATLFEERGDCFYNNGEYKNALND